jgi:uncharacterized protein
MSEDQLISRRQLLRGSAIGGGALLSQVGLAEFAAEAWAKDAQATLPRRTLGKTGEKVPVLLQGGSMSWDTKWDPKLAEAFKQGIDYFDTAWVYSGGTSEQAIGSFLERTKMRKKVWITSKSNKHDPAGFESRLGESLARMKTDHVDMYYLHGIDDPGLLSTEMMKTVEKLKKEKKIRFFGFSCHDGNVAPLLQAAAKTPWVDSVMFRYNFRQYGNKDLNDAIDAAHKAKVGLIAMKTQGSAISFEQEWQKFRQTGKWNKFQAVLKAVWADERITAAVSDMDSLEKIRENADAARDGQKLGALDLEELRRYAHATRGAACDGCDHHCGPAVGSGIPVGTVLRYLMYHDSYGKQAEARALYQALPESAKQWDVTRLPQGSAACPHGVDVAQYMGRARSVLA